MRIIPQEIDFLYGKKYFSIAIFQQNFLIRTQFATLKQGYNIKYLPYVFTEQGVAMLSSVLNSERAIKVNIQIMRAFVKLKELLLTHRDLAIKLEAIERKYADHDEKIQNIFQAIRQLMAPPEEPKRRIGFHAH